MFRLFWVVATLLTPASALHELTHLLVAKPFAAETEYQRVGLSERARLVWECGTPTAWVRLAHLAPTLLGVGMALVMLPLLPALEDAVVLVGTALAYQLGMPEAAPELSALVGMGVLVNWVVYAWPSYGDRHPFHGGEDS